ncbi:MAG: glycogen synthase [Chitinophagaceae bacterium]|nr:glycogen synthase [Chitinophagaceae bacterium]
MEILHVSAECYPVAKAGGLGDVVGALPKYQQDAGHNAKVVMPMYRTKFLLNNEFDVVHKGYTNIGDYFFDYTIIKETTDKLGFGLYLIDINGLLDREKIYGYDDDVQRFTAFQVCVVDWIASWQFKPDVVHVHDYHAGLIPFMMKYCYRYNQLAAVPTVLTIHNAQYQGWMTWEQSVYLPPYDDWKRGMLEWGGSINPLASAVKCADKVTTVSNSYMDELRYMSNGLEALFEYERGKCTGILNGIDTQVWDPETDKYIKHDYSLATVEEGKAKNKAQLCETFGLDINKPLFVLPSRVEPCGLNQMYSMRYGTVPLVRNTGGLKDTVKDILTPNGYGIVFDQATVGDVCNAVWRACELYNNKEKFETSRETMMKLDFSWESSVQQYLALYQSLR